MLTHGSGIWAPALRFHEGNFYIVTTLVDDELAADDASRWDNVRYMFFSHCPSFPLTVRIDNSQGR